MALSASKLRHRVTIQRRAYTQNPDSGEVTESWSNFLVNIAAGIEPLSVREFIAARAVQSKVTARITVRYVDGMDATMRILHRGKIYCPEGMLPDKDSGLETITVPCFENVNDGQ